MRPFSREWLASEGFAGFFTFKELGPADVPNAGGVYVVLYEGSHSVEFLESSTGGWFKGKDPTVDRSVLGPRWVAASPVVYVGMATSLKARLRQLRAFGMG